MANRNHFFFTGLMLLSFFFGAGNLIFPPFLGLEAGTNFWPATIGFVVTAIALPLLTLVAVAQAETPQTDGMVAMGNRVHPWFGIGFAVAIYLSIGAMYGIPRAANVGYEMGFKSISGLSGGLNLAVYVAIFFTICYIAARHSGHLVDWVGKILTPILIATIALLCWLAFRDFSLATDMPSEKYAQHPLSAGIVEGYFTMDALAALAFGSVIIRAIGKGVNGDGSRSLVRQVMLAGIVAGIGLGAVYLSLAWIGAAYKQTEPFANGAELLMAAAVDLIGSAGSILFGTIVILACLTTCIGLINACSHFAHELYPRIAYRRYVLLFTLAGALFSNLGLQELLGIAVPMLVFLYPVAIMLVLLNLCHRIIGAHDWAYKLGIGLTLIFALADMLIHLQIDLPWWQSLVSHLPFANMGLSWLIPCLTAAVIGRLLPPSKSLKTSAS